MEESRKIHQMQIVEREKGTITGVVDVRSFDTGEILMETTRGMLTIRGKELHVARLQLETGEVDIEGTVESLVYTLGGEYKKHMRGSLIKRLWQ